MRAVNITDLRPTDPCLQCMIMWVGGVVHSASLEVLALASLTPSFTD